MNEMPNSDSAKIHISINILTVNIYLPCVYIAYYNIKRAFRTPHTSVSLFESTPVKLCPSPFIKTKSDLGFIVEKPVFS